LAPDFELPDLAGRLHTLSELRGKKVFLLFWASW
jgi:peroxiredoxin